MFRFKTILSLYLFLDKILSIFINDRKGGIRLSQHRIQAKISVEIERKYIIEETPDFLGTYPYKSIKQAYISMAPVIRIRQIGEDFILTIKGKGHIEREEFELTISQSEFEHLSKKTEGIVIHKTRYFIPYNHYTIELDIFHDYFEGLVLAEVEFSSMDDANSFIPPNWFGRDVSENPNYKNSSLAKGKRP